MRKILWAILFFMLYVYITTTGRDEFFLEKGKAIYESILSWFDDADVDFHLKKETTKKHKRRWR